MSSEYIFMLIFFLKVCSHIKDCRVILWLLSVTLDQFDILFFTVSCNKTFSNQKIMKCVWYLV